jgi:hypothetical protein
VTDLPWNLEYFGEVPPPDAPVALPATNVTANGFVTSWTAVDRAASYRLYIATDAGFVDMVPGYNGRQVAGLSFNANDLEQGVDYFYRVTAVNPYGESDPSNTITAFTDFVDAPVAIAATNVQEDGFAANWNPVVDPDLDHYELDVSQDGFATLSPYGAPVQIPAGTETHQVTGLAPEEDFEYRVRAVKVNGTTSVNSNVIDVTTEQAFVGAGGDDVIYFDELNETVHIFDTIGESTFEVLQGSRPVRRLIVAGGGKGGGVNGSGVSCGGGGGGGVLDLDEDDRPDELVVGEYPVVVGKGGTVAGALNIGEDGDDSSFDGDVAIGGGRGGGAGGDVGSGGSGGGATNSSGTEFGGNGTPGQGNDGGDAPAGSGGGAGGGGAGAPGENGTGPKGGDGGDGVESAITGEAIKYGAGGGGGVRIALFEAPGAVPGFGGDDGGGSGVGGGGPGTAGTGIGSGGGGATGNNPGGNGTKGRVAIRYRGRGEGVIIPPPDVPPDYLGPITFDGCLRENEVDDVVINVDCNARIDSGIYPDYQRYLCIGGGVIKSSRSMQANALPSQLPDDPLPGGEHGITNGTLVFRFSVPIRAFKITRRITAGADAVPILIACDDYTVVPHPTSSVPGSSKDGAIVNAYKQTPQAVYYPAFHYEPAVDLGAEEEMELIREEGFTCVVIQQSTKFPSEFVDPMFAVL